MKRHFIINLCLIIALSACIPTIGQTADTDSQDMTTQEPVSGDDQASDPVQQPSTSAPTGSATSKLNCREGPNVVYDNLAILEEGEGGEIISKYTNYDPPWYQLELSDGTQCWVSGDLLTISGDTSSVQVTTILAPTPTPAPIWAGIWQIWVRSGFSGSTDIQSEMTCTEVGVNVNCTWHWPGYTHSFDIEATISDDPAYLTGTMVRNDGHGPWNINFKLHNPNQFGGKWYWPPTFADGDFCGARPGFDAPVPCK